jgi:hypothetical protein
MESVEAELPEDARLTADAGYFSEDKRRDDHAHGLDSTSSPVASSTQSRRPTTAGPIPRGATPKQRMAGKR